MLGESRRGVGKVPMCFNVSTSPRNLGRKLPGSGPATEGIELVIFCAALVKCEDFSHVVTEAEHDSTTLSVAARRTGQS
jgi:hypothetical protein